MSTVCVVAPPNWLPLVQALEAAGHTCVSLLGDAPSPNAFEAVQRIMVEGHVFESALELAAPAALIDLNKTVRAVGVPDPVRSQFAAFRQHLSTAYGVRRFVEEAIARNGATAVVVVCTYDVPGRAALAAAGAAGVPVVHVQHNCVAHPPEAAWFAAEAPGDVVLVPGERDRDWWRRCNPEANVKVTGHPLWDVYHGLPRVVPPERPVVLWADQSPTNADSQTAAYWESRDVPELAWQAFLAWLDRWDMPVGPIGGVVFKGRGREADGYTLARQEALVRVCSRHGFGWRYFDGPPAEAFTDPPGVSVAVVQDSNLGVEALHLGIPVVSITRPGSTLFDYGGVWCVNGTRTDLSSALDEAIRGSLHGDEDVAVDADDWAADAALLYNRGAADGQAMARTVAAIGTVAAGGVAALEREAVAA